ncbi:MAG: protein kinase [Polaromonas sp.]|nr:protein kinase [Polaromonas sp.]
MSNESPDDDRTVIVGSSKPTPIVDMPPPAAPVPASSTAPSAPPLASSSNTASSAGDSGNALPTGTYIGEFELTETLGEGGFGIVYKAWDHSLERRVALKEYMPSSLAARSGETQVQVKSERHRETFDLGRKSFINEAKLLAQFDHPALVKVYRFWEANGTAYMVMPLYDGVTLKDRLRQLTNPPDESWLMELLGPLTEALAVIHAEHCFHRDIAPDNVILLSSNGRPLLLDFGAARRVIGDMTQALTVILKPGYAPVEQYAEAPHMKQGAWTDVYALAATIHFAIVGKTPPASVSRLMGDSYQSLTQVAGDGYSERFLSAIDKALRVRPDERTQSIAELRADLGLDAVSDRETHAHFHPAAARVAQGDLAPTQLLQAPSVSATVMQQGSRMGLWIGLGALVLGGVGVGGYLMTRPAAAPSVVQANASAPSLVTTPGTRRATTPATTVATSPVIAGAPLPRRFEALTEFDRVVAAQNGGFSVQAVPAKNQLRIGRDSLSFNVTSNKEGHVQVLLLGPDGSLLQLFPNSQAKDGRIKAGQTLKLPQANWPLEAAEPVGAEHFLVVVSAQPRDYAVLSTERDYIFLKLPTGERADALLNQWSPASPILLGTVPKECQSAECEAYGAAKFTMEVVR